MQLWKRWLLLLIISFAVLVITLKYIVTSSSSYDINDPKYSEDCMKLSHLFHTSWPPDKPKAAFYYLTRSDRFAQLRESLIALDKYFNARYGYPVIIFLEADDTMPYPQLLQTFTSSRLYFQSVSFTIPDFIDASRVKFDIPCLSRVGYRHMCRFQAKTVYEERILSDVDYVWRLDDDSLLLSEVKYDVFSYMRDQQLLYGYKFIHWDSLDCVKDLWPHTQDYAKSHGISSDGLSSWPVARMYYNNFEISSLSVWRSEEYKSYIEYIDLLGGMYYHRWGDAPIKSLAVALFVPSNKTHQFTDIAYQHGRFVNNTFI